MAWIVTGVCSDSNPGLAVANLQIPQTWVGERVTCTVTASLCGDSLNREYIGCRAMYVMTGCNVHSPAYWGQDGPLDEQKSM